MTRIRSDREASYFGAEILFNLRRIFIRLFDTHKLFFSKIRKRIFNVPLDFYTLISKKEKRKSVSMVEFDFMSTIF